MSSAAAGHGDSGAGHTDASGSSGHTGGGSEASHADAASGGTGHADSGAAHFIAEHVCPNLAIINGGDGRHAHPTQGMLDVYALCRALKGGRETSFDLSGVTRNMAGPSNPHRRLPTSALAERGIADEAKLESGRGEEARGLMPDGAVIIAAILSACSSSSCLNLPAID